MITLIIPTTDNRDQLLQRALNYYLDYKIKIIIVDGAKQSKKIKNKNVEYFHYPKLSVEERILQAVKKTNNDFILISQDDDFINFPVLKKALRILKENKDIAWIGGDQIYFVKYFGYYLFHKLREYSDLDFYKKSEKYHFKSDNLQKRILYFVKYQPQLVASLFKKRPLMKALKDYVKLDLYINKKINKVYAESVYSVFISLYGKYHHINDIFQFRDLKAYSNPNHLNKLNSKNGIKITFEDIKNSDATRNFKRFLAGKISKKDNFLKLFDNSIYSRKSDYKYKFSQTDKIKDYLRKNLLPFFLFFKIINYFMNLGNILYANFIKKRFSRYKNLNNYWKKISTKINFKKNFKN